MTGSQISYPEAIAEFAAGIAEGSTARALSVPAPVSEIERAALHRPDVSDNGLVFIEIDRALLTAMGITPESEAGDLYTHLWPVAVRIDGDGDLVLHVTTAERAQSEVAR